jgi:arginase
MTNPAVVVLPVWQGSLARSARRLAAGSGFLAAAAGLTARPVAGLPANRSPRRHGVDSYDALLAARAAAEAALPDGPVLAIGGDCGADLSLVSRELTRRDGDLAILWIDAHADFNTPGSSPSGAYHGMVLRALSGQGLPGLTAARPASPGSLVLAGTRSVDDGEQDELDAAGVTPLGMAAFSQPGAVAAALRSSGRSALHVHLDLDVLDPAEFVHTSWPEPGGATVGQVLELLQTAAGILPVTSAFVGEYVGADPAGAACVAPLMTWLQSSLKR